MQPAHGAAPERHRMVHLNKADGNPGIDESALAPDAVEAPATIFVDIEPDLEGAGNGGFDESHPAQPAAAQKASSWSAEMTRPSS